jgi:hypothetical protein
MGTAVKATSRKQFSIARLFALLTVLGLWLPFAKALGGVVILHTTIGLYVLAVIAWATLRGPGIFRELMQSRRDRRARRLAIEIMLREAKAAVESPTEPQRGPFHPRSRELF